ncbi:hypothetical protein TUM4438_41770 [Shewanella sairae]|uniref:Uncharacterized protein n=1 Tax=Shewanella sairae TaxID=190310 RepID=A0ABQ4PQZ2_9GAMM|nr:hypothetical protein [Shewanella sairae]MCL1130383.1 hypothetical protein [Shewanella sairae]GIU51588.1 hypothetical protein TUM4438_41770 [Shewanella sairae]
MSRNIKSPWQTSILVLTTLLSTSIYTTESYAAETKLKPWDFDSNIYREQLESNRDKLIYNKKVQWDECSRMAPATDRAALGVQLNTADFAREMIRHFHPVDFGDFSDVINQKIMDLAFEMADMADGNKTSDESPVTQAAWDWCIAQDPAHFSDF